MRGLRVPAVLPAFLLLAACGRDGVVASRPNVVLISIGSLRADHLSAYAYARPTSPNLDRVAREGTLFTRAYAASSWTIPSHMTMFTGLPPSLHGVDDVGKRLDPAHLTLAERLRASGYQTAAFVSGPLMHAAFGFDQGFEHYENTTTFEDGDFLHGDPTRPTARARQRAQQEIAAPAVTQAVEHWIEMDVRPPFFLFVHLNDPDHDYMPPPPYDTRFDPEWKDHFDFSDVAHNATITPEMPARAFRHLVALYDGEIAASDAVVGRILAGLEQRRWLDDTLVVVTADHGEELFDHGGKGHGSTLFEEVLRVPLILRLPDVVRPGRRTPAIFGAVHLMPTILGLVGLAATPEVRGEDLSGLLRGEEPPPDLWAFAELARGSLRQYAARVGDRKYVGRAPAADPSALTIEYYGLSGDPEEQHRQPAQDRDAREFEQQLRAHLAAIDAERSALSGRTVLP